MLERFLSGSNLQRATDALGKLQHHEISGFALTGGFATEIYCLRYGRPCQMRDLNDIDFIVESFAAIPASFARDFLFRHVHPSDPPGKTILQCVDAANSLRIDVFRAFGDTMRRASMIELAGYSFRLISLEDLTARAARLALDVAGGVPTPAKYARDYLRLAALAEPARIEEAWQDQRKTTHPATFREANDLLQAVIPERPHLLITSRFSKEPEQCPRCKSTPAFAIAEPDTVLSLLGYC